MATQAAGTIFVNETFTDSNGTELTAHDADWTNVFVDIFGPGPEYVEIQSNVGFYIWTDFLAQFEYHNDGNAPLSNDYDVRASLLLDDVAGGSNAMLLGRWSGDLFTGSDGYVVVMASGGLTLYKYVSGTPTSLGTHSATINDDTFYDVELRLRDGEQDVWFEGASVINTSDSAITQIGVVGFAGAGAADGDVQIDDFVAQDVTGGATALPPMDIIWIG